MIDLTALRALADAAVGGPWIMITDLDGAWTVLDRDDMWVAEVGRDRSAAAFIAMARTAVPELLDRVEALEAEVARMRPVVEALRFGEDYDQLGSFKVFREDAPQLFAADDGNALYLTEAIKRAIDAVLVTK